MTKIFLSERISRFSTLCTLWSFLNFCITISWNQLYCKLFTKEIVFTEIFQKVVLQKFSKIHSVLCILSVEIREVLSHRKFFFPWNQFFRNFLLKTLLSRKFCQKCVRVNFRNFYNFTGFEFRFFTEFYNFLRLKCT